MYEIESQIKKKIMYLWHPLAGNLKCIWNTDLVSVASIDSGGSKKGKLGEILVSTKLYHKIQIQNKKLTKKKKEEGETWYVTWAISNQRGKGAS